MDTHKNQVILWEILRFSLIFGMILMSTFATGQFGEKGVLFSIGMGSGYSTHAESYQVEDQVRIREYPGFRIYIFDAKLGWNFGEQTAIYLTGNISPGNTTITPYRSKYAGLEYRNLLVTPLHFM